MGFPLQDFAMSQTLSASTMKRNRNTMGKIFHYRYWDSIETAYEYTSCVVAMCAHGLCERSIESNGFSGNLFLCNTGATNCRIGSFVFDARWYSHLGTCLRTRIEDIAIRRCLCVWWFANINHRFSMSQCTMVILGITSLTFNSVFYKKDVL